uniref:Ig-like domain-containing protein n=1 Tax=Pygocentrus nattereri TaxID=42514 RepID=A0A3B4CEL0_PYGNA
MQGTYEETSNILVLRSSANYSGKTFVCHAKHPLAKESRQCVLKLGKDCLSYCSKEFEFNVSHSKEQYTIFELYHYINFDSSPAEGMSVWMRCVVEKGTGPINYIWEQESQTGLLTTLVKWNSSLVNVTWVTRNHTGWYRCLARNEVNQQRSDRVLCLDGPDLPQIDVTTYSVMDRGYIALEKGSVSLMCQASSNPPGQYIWFYNNSEIFSGAQLTITRVLRGHVGYYTCLAQNTHLNTRSKKTKKQSDLTSFSSH